MLLVWWFALTAGIVNACVIEPAHGGAAAPAMAIDEATEATDQDTDQDTDQATTVASYTPAEDAAAPVHAHPPAPDGHQPCSKFCEDGSTSVPTFKQPDARLPIVLAPLPTAALTVQAALVSRRDGLREPAPVQAPVPIPIEFLRLTL